MGDPCLVALASEAPHHGLLGAGELGRHHMLRRRVPAPGIETGMWGPLPRHTL
jgi:hypothetical protein